MWYYSYKEFERVTDLPFYMVGIGCHDRQWPVEKPEGHRRDQFFYNTRGSGTLTYNGKRISLPEGSGFFVPRDTPHGYSPDGDVWDLRWVSCGGEGLNMLIKHFGITPMKAYRIENAGALDEVLAQMHRSMMLEPDTGIYYASNLVGTFVTEFARQAGLMASGQVLSADIYTRNMALIREYIEYNYMHDISLEELAEQLGLSPQHLCRIFKRCTGKRPMEYINEVRIDKAKTLLIETDDTVEHIAQITGFQNTNYFCRLFRQSENTTPGRYRSGAHT